MENNQYVVDVHNHLHLLPKPLVKATEALFGHSNDMDFIYDNLTRNNQKGIISVALYNLPFFNAGVQTVANQIQQVKDFAAKYDDVKIIKTKKDLNEDYRLGFLFHLESARWFHEDLSVVQKLWNLGVVGLLPVHFIDSWVGGSCDEPKSKIFKSHQKGLTGLGRELLQEMSRVGMWMDLSHMNDLTFKEAIENFDGHVCCSHIAARSLKDVDRNISDVNIELLRDKGGYFGISAWTRLLGKEEATLKTQIDHLLELGMEDRLMLGSDFGPPITTYDSNKCMFNFDSLVYKHSPNKEIGEKIAYQNAINFFNMALPD
jgi:membrane dipeptidase